MQPVREGGGAQQPAGDAGEDQGDVGGTEGAALDVGAVAEAALAKGSGEEGAVVDELADEAEKAAGAAGFGGGLASAPDIRGGKHRVLSVARIFFLWRILGFPVPT